MGGVGKHNGNIILLKEYVLDLINSLHFSILEQLFYEFCQFCVGVMVKRELLRTPQWLYRLNCEKQQKSGRRLAWPADSWIDKQLGSPSAKPTHPFAFCTVLQPFLLYISIFSSPLIAQFCAFFPFGSSHTKRTHNQKCCYVVVLTHRERHKTLEQGQIQLISQTATSPHHQR